MIITYMRNQWIEINPRFETSLDIKLSFINVVKHISRTCCPIFSSRWFLFVSTPEIGQVLCVTLCKVRMEFEASLQYLLMAARFSQVGSTSIIFLYHFSNTS